MLLAVLERGQQLGIYSDKPGQVLGVYPIGFVLVLVDQAQLTSVGYQHFVAALFQKPADPGRMGSHFDGDAHGLVALETLPEGLGSGAQPTLFYDLAALGIEKAQVAVLVAEIQTRRHLRLLLVSIAHGPILLCWAARARKYLQTLKGYCVGGGPSHPIS